MCFEKLGLRYRYSGSSIFSVSRYLRGTTFLCIINVEPFRSTRSPTLLPPIYATYATTVRENAKGLTLSWNNLAKKWDKLFGENDSQNIRFGESL